MDKTELENKIDSFVKKHRISKKRPLSNPDAELAIIKLRKEAKMSFSKIREFLKKELDIDVSVQSISQKYNALMLKQQKGD